MAKRGRKPQSPALRLLKGSAQVAAGVPAAVDLGPPPGDLDGVGSAEWVRVTGELGAAGVLMPTDRPALAVYCDAYSRWTRARAEISRPGTLTIMTDNGSEKPNPAVGVANASARLMLAALAPFGERLRARPPAEKQDELAAFLSQRTSS